MHKFSAHTLFIGKKVVSLPSCHSTNDIAASLVPNKDTYEGTMVITDSQTAGKGQRGNSWEAEPDKNLTFSIILRPTFLQIPDQFYLSMLTSLAIFDVFGKYVPEGLKIKWPNDIFFNDNKLGGILIENIVQSNKITSAIVGVGLNINQVKFRYDQAISLANICGHSFGLKNLLQVFLSALEGRYLQLKNGERQKIRAAYLKRLYWREEEHIFKGLGFFSGKIKDIDNQGKLGVEIDKKREYFDLKEIKFIR